MKTLYDLLGALPLDDAEDLRAAFRGAVKGAHPDVRPGDPDAALKFRQIVRANEILGDVEQRAAYDHLLDLARLERESASRRATAGRVYKLASGVIAFAGASVVAVSGYLLFIHMSAASVATAGNLDVNLSPSAEIAANPAAAADADSAALAKRESISILAEALLSRAAMPRPDMVSFREADDGAAADLEQRIQLDPRVLPAYIDRGIIFYRPRKSGHAFPEVAAAQRPEKASRSKPVPMMARAMVTGKPHHLLERTAAATPVQRTAAATLAQRTAAAPPAAMLLYRRQMAEQDASREPWVR